MQTYLQQLATQATLVWPIYKPVIEQWTVLLISVGFMLIFTLRSSRSDSLQFLRMDKKILWFALVSFALTILFVTIFIVYKYHWSFTPDILTVLHFDLNATNFIVISIIMELGIGIFTLLAIVGSSIPLAKIGFKPQNLDILKIIATVVVSLIIVIGVREFFKIYFPFKSSSGPAKIYAIAVSAGLLYKIWLIVFPPIIEEILFRGIFFQYLRSFLSVRLALIIQAALFAGAHVEPTAFLRLFIFGLVFGLAYQRTKLIYVPMILHATVQALAIFV